MRKEQLPLTDIALDTLGRAILADNMLEKIEVQFEIMSAGANLSCGGSTNGSCSNSYCGNSNNSSCVNSTSCAGATNQIGCGGNGGGGKEPY